MYCSIKSLCGLIYHTSNMYMYTSQHCANQSVENMNTVEETMMMIMIIMAIMTMSVSVTTGSQEELATVLVSWPHNIHLTLCGGLNLYTSHHEIILSP